jgi:hypothetical protein
MRSTKEALLQSIEQSAQVVEKLTPDNLEQLETLLASIQHASSELFQPGNPYGLDSKEIELLQQRFAQIVAAAEALAQTIAGDAEALRQQGEAAAAYLKHSG